MKIDVPTLMLALFLGFMLLSLQLWIAQRGALRQPELRTWAQGSWAMLGGFSVVFIRRWLPDWGSILIGNGLFFLSVALYSKALFRYLLDRALPRWFWMGLALACCALVWMRDWDLPLRTSIVSFLIGALLAPATLLTLVRGWRCPEGSMRTVGLTLGMTSLTLYFRGVHALIYPEQYASAVQGALGPGLAFLISFICLMAAGFGFVLACFERVALRMEEMATTDGLTGCLNRVTTDTLIAHTLERGRREGSPVAFCLLDIDHFKHVNDSFGHQAGDTVLRTFAQTVRNRLRASDVVGRMGGEEFGMLLPATDAPGAARIAELVRAAVEALEFADPQGKPFKLTVSAGVVVAASNSGLSATRLYMLADGALYRAKALGRNRVQLAEDLGEAPVRPLESIENTSSKTVAGNFS